MKRFISDFWNGGRKGHELYDFVDVSINCDVLLFIDPMFIENADDDFCKELKYVIKSFFDSFYCAYRDNDYEMKLKLLSHAGEPNATHLGYGGGIVGRGNTAKGLLEAFSPLEDFLKDISTIDRAEDLTVLLPNFAEDGLSDLLTNVLHDLLNKYTKQQMKKFGVIPTDTVYIWTWDTSIQDWINVQRSCFCINGKEVLLVPKRIVRKSYLFNTNQYFGRIILERMRDDGKYMYEGKPLSKKDIIRAKRYSGAHWQYDEVISYSKKYNDALAEYHDKMPLFYIEKGNPMTDEELDEYVYGYSVKKHDDIA